MTSNKKRILVTAGEPASISSEITVKAICTELKNFNDQLILITDPTLIEDTMKILNKKIKINVLKNLNNFFDYVNQLLLDLSVHFLVEYLRRLQAGKCDLKLTPN